MKYAALLVRQAKTIFTGTPPGKICMGADQQNARLQEGWVIANHILVSFHVAFISSILAIPEAAASKTEVLRFIFVSPETIISAVFTYLPFHSSIALHELGHFLEAARLRALNDSIQEQVEAKLAAPRSARWLYLLQLLIDIPYGRAVGVKREGLRAAGYLPPASSRASSRSHRSGGGSVHAPESAAGDEAQAAWQRQLAAEAEAQTARQAGADMGADTTGVEAGQTLTSAQLSDQRQRAAEAAGDVDVLSD